MMNMEVSQLTCQPQGAKSPILREVSAVFEPGHLTALLGPNGSGKTTLLRHFLSQLQANGGKVMVNGRDPHEYPARELAKILSWVPQNSNGESAFTVEEVVEMARYPYKKAFDETSDEDRSIVNEAMTAVEVSDLRKRCFASLSGGERQRVLIARAMAQRTPWILMDEPTSNLDVRHQIEMLQVLRSKVDAGETSAIVVMHDFNLVAKYCDRAVLLKDGEVVATGATSDVMEPKKIEEVYGVKFEVIEQEGRRLFFPLAPIRDRMSDNNE